MLVPTAAFATDSNQPNYIEHIVIVGSSNTTTVTDVAVDFSMLETVMPSVSYVAGGYGGFAGFTERGTQTVHTTVYRNGVPVNDAGSGWYDFAHNIVTGLESVKIVNGPNSTLYGSGSLGGTVFISDNLTDQVLLRSGENHTLMNVTMLDSFSVSHFDVNNGSVMNTNSESDNYTNTTIRYVEQFGNFEFASTYTEYDYDYDNCFTASFVSSNDCLQSGEKTNLSLRNDNLTVGYSNNKSEYFTEGTSTWSSNAERFYLDSRETFEFSEFDITAGLTLDEEKYAGESASNSSVYALITMDNRLQVGTRVNEDAAVFRVGFSHNDFFVNASTSYRNPTLYQQIGDSYVNSNSSLDPEEGHGVELGYGPLSVFGYSFKENIDYNFELNQFVNTGEYDSNGIRYDDTFAVPYGSFCLFAAYTNSDQPRVPQYKARASYFASIDRFDAQLIYAAQFNRGVDTLGGTLDDIQSFDFVLLLNLNSRLTVQFTVQDLLDNVVEVLPGYDAGGRKYFLTLQYK